MSQITQAEINETEYTGADAIADAKTMGWFLRLHQIEAIAADPNTRLTQILVRCGGGRFSAPAQDVLHFIACIEGYAKANPAAEHADYVRDCSLAVSK